MGVETNEIVIVPAAEGRASARGQKGFFTPSIEAARFNTQLLRQNLADFVTGLNDALKGLPELVEGFKLEEIAVVVEVNGEGSIQMLGGVKVGASGGITLKLTR